MNYVIQLRGTLEKRFQTDRNGAGLPLVYGSIREASAKIHWYISRGARVDFRIAELHQKNAKPLSEAELRTALGECGFEAIKSNLVCE